MSHFPHGAIIAAQQARERRRRDEEEEEEMTRYTTEDLDKNWEFKIVRSESGAFRKPEVFHNLLQEESLAGWELVEKLDNRRVRFKRPREARRRDTSLPPGYDPYRSLYGSATRRTAILIAVALITAFTGAFIAIGFGSGMFNGSGAGSGIVLPIIILTGIITMVIAAISFIRMR
jgi:hypothetical protein